jgi:hypothetical protein
MPTSIITGVQINDQSPVVARTEQINDNSENKSRNSRSFLLANEGQKRDFVDELLGTESKQAKTDNSIFEDTVDIVDLDHLA